MSWNPHFLKFNSIPKYSHDREKERATANVHCFSHLYRYRDEIGKPMWEWSAEFIEASYSVARRTYQSGTRNVPKQLLENGYLRLK